MAAALSEILADGRASEERRRRGLELVKRYTWDVSADAHLALFRAIAVGEPV